MKVRTTALAMALALSVTMLSACGGQGSTSKPDASSPAASSPAVSTPAVSTPAESTPDTSAPSVSTPDVSAPSTSTPDASTPDASTPEQKPLSSLSLNKSDITLFKAGESYTLKAEASVEGQDNLSLVGDLNWTSSDETIATVDKNGTVTAVAPGTAEVTLEHNGLTVSCIIRCDWTVEEAPEVVEPSAPEAPETTEPSAPAASVDLLAFYTQLMETIPEDNRPFMMELDADMAEGVYPGLSAIETKQSVLRAPAMSAVPFEISIVECANAADVEAVKAIFQTRIDNQINGGAWYPETIENWEKNAKIVVNGNFVGLFVSAPELVNAAGEFEKLF